MKAAVISTPIGNLRILENKSKVVAIEFTEEKEIKPQGDFINLVKAELNEYFKGQRTKFGFACEPAGTEFQQRVWLELGAIPYGETISYQQLAERLGDPKVIRAAAAANGKNPIAIAIPCHRVIGADGSMTGYAGGLERKKALLRLEGAEIMSQIDLFNEV